MPAYWCLTASEVTKVLCLTSNYHHRKHWGCSMSFVYLISCGYVCYPIASCVTLDVLVLTNSLSINILTSCGMYCSNKIHISCHQLTYQLISDMRKEVIIVCTNVFLPPSHTALQLLVQLNYQLHFSK